MKNMSLQKIQAQDRNSLFNKVKQNKTYLYIRLMGIKEPKLQKPQQTTLGDKKLRLRFEMSNKVCSTSFETNNFGTIPQKQLSQLQKQTHLFCYEAEEMLNMQLNVYKQSKQSTKAKICQYGYSRVVISPFIALPHTRHCVDVPMIQSDCYQKVGNQTIAVVSLQIFYLLKFQGELCNFQRSLLLGEMRLCCIFQMNGQRQKSILDQQGGIHPRWHQFAKSLDPKKLLNKEQKKYESNMLKFKLDSVGHTLKLEVVNFPELDKDAQIVGSAQIYIASKDYLRVPKSNKNENEKRKKIKLTYIDPVTKLVSEAGQIEVGVIFDFDAKTQRLLADSQSQQQSSEQNEN